MVLNMKVNKLTQYVFLVHEELVYDQCYSDEEAEEIAKSYGASTFMTADRYAKRCKQAINDPPE